MPDDALKRSAVLDAAALCETEWESEGTYSLDDAITRLESGKQTGDFEVDFGDGVAARVSPGPGLLQRLKGHRMLLAVAGGAADLSATRPQDRGLFIDPDAAALLGAMPSK